MTTIPQGSDAASASESPPSPQPFGDLALAHLSVADALAWRFRCPGHDADDLRQVARLGLVKAAQRYRAGLGHGFVPYAVPTIAGELKRYLRDQSWVVRPPRSIQELRLRLNAVRPALAQRLGHEPSTAELSEALGASLAAVAEVQIAEAAMVGRPIEHVDSTTAVEGRRVIPVLGFEDSGFDRVDQAQSLARALADATEQDRRLIYLRFDREMTQEAIAEELGVSQMQVSRLLRRLLDRLRRRMAA